MRLPLPPFEPDKSKFDTSVAALVLNALPSASGWKGMPAPSVISEALPGECRGYIYVRTASGTNRCIACTQTGIYRLNTTDFSWDDIGGASSPYSGPGEQESWVLTRFGKYLVIHNYNDPIQVYDIELDTNVTDLGGTPPQAKYSWVAGDFLVLGYLNEVGGQARVRWSEINNIGAWELGENGADFQDLPEGDEVMAGFASPGGFIVMQRRAMQFFQFAPASGYTFTRQVVNANYGTISPRSVVPVGPGQFFFLSEDGFFSGAERRPIGAERVDGYLLENIDKVFLQDVQGVADPLEKIVWWRYRLVNGEYRLLGYDWQVDRWTTSNVDVGEMAALATPATSIDALDAIYGNLDAIPVSLDSRIFTGGRPTFSAFNSDNMLTYFSGLNLEAKVETAQVEPDPNLRTFCKGSRIQTDAASFTVEHGTAPYHGQAITYAAAASINRAGYVPHRGDGRLHKFRITIPAGTVWSVVTSLEADFKRTGMS